MTIDQAYTLLYSIALLALTPLLLVLLVRSIKGPLVTDRLVAVNMIGTMVIVAFMILANLLEEGYLTDVALLYAMISFAAVLIFSSIYIRRKKEDS